MKRYLVVVIAMILFVLLLLSIVTFNWIVDSMKNTNYGFIDLQDGFSLRKLHSTKIALVHEDQGTLEIGRIQKVTSTEQYIFFKILQENQTKLGRVDRETFQVTYYDSSEAFHSATQLEPEDLTPVDDLFPETRGY